jgi:FMN phosphatase YigB (HAD superfamily)
VANATHCRKFFLEKPVSLTLLLDLDNTLLVNEMDVFLPAYFQGFARHVAPVVDPDQFIECLLAATARTIENDLPMRTLLETFNQYFYSGLGVPRENLQPKIDSFYKNIYPKLRQHTRVQPATKNLIETARQRGFTVAIATNPLFPREAIEQRLVWSGIPPAEYQFDLISSLETFHFSKPNPAYFAEVLAQLGWPEGPAVVVGDDPENDIAPAQTMGLPTFQVFQNGERSQGVSSADGYGDLADFLPWLDRMELNALTTAPSSPPAMLSILASTPAALDTMITRSSSDRLLSKPSAEEWSITEVLCHLRDVEAEVQLPRIQTILREDNPFLSAENTDAWAATRGYAAQDGQKALADFAASRATTLGLLRTLPDDLWSRRVRHAIFGPTSLLELVHFMTEHDRLHIQQIHKLALIDKPVD